MNYPVVKLRNEKGSIREDRIGFLLKSEKIVVPGADPKENKLETVCDIMWRYVDTEGNETNSSDPCPSAHFASELQFVGFYNEIYGEESVVNEVNEDMVKLVLELDRLKTPIDEIVEYTNEFGTTDNWRKANHNPDVTDIRL